MTVQKYILKGWVVCIFIVITFGCKNNNALLETNQLYLKQKYQFDSEFVNHFPLRIERHPMRIWSDTNAVSDHVRIMLEIDFTKHLYDSLINEFDSKSIANYKAADSCLLIVNRFTQRDNWHLRNKYKYVDKAKIDKDCYDTRLPIPNFWDNPYVTFETETRLPSDFDIYVFEANKGEFWDKSHRTNGQYMPVNWKNGFSKGVAISKKRKKLIYWFILW